MIAIGAFFIPEVNQLADWFTGFKQTDANLNNSVHVYPGEHYCKYDQGHSLWHEVSSNGLLDLIYLCDYTHSLIKTYTYTRQRSFSLW